ncbi:DUF3833 domain-containing protein [Vibrio rhizosphaerae]|uniref:DUF3833 domain-containing protein n=1 Tax=Vibrio rhizosphaerae TaxID=398736 RepID=A0ABU4ISQ2_9VIBR|nr:DUF3833 domain-containing protein [Vibrio rhizosphaerae]MDW6092409.1 DUF3833 domain-containing protein [Vibrio rhizosphaerae]
MKHMLTVVSLVMLILITGCSADLKEYQASQPTFDLFGYFQGETHAWGMVQDYSGKQTRRFKVHIKGTVTGNTLTLAEDFVFHDGEKNQRIWTITRSADGHYQGRADDIIGVATGQEVGNALQWQYDFLLKTDDSEITVSFDDWLFRQDEKRLFNVTSIRKFGLEVGRITLFFEK